MINQTILFPFYNCKILCTEIKLHPILNSNIYCVFIINKCKYKQNLKIIVFCSGIKKRIPWEWCTFSIFRGLLFIATCSWPLHLLLLRCKWGTGLLILKGLAPTTGLSLLLLGQNIQTLKPAKGSNIFRWLNHWNVCWCTNSMNYLTLLA